MKVSPYLERPLRTLAQVAAARSGENQERDPPQAVDRGARKRRAPDDPGAPSSVKETAPKLRK